MPTPALSTTPISSETSIFVVGFVTDSGTGGFDWRFEREDAERLRSGYIHAGDGDVSDVREFTLGQLALERNYTDEAITDALDSWPEAWEPSEGQGRAAT